MKLSFQKLSDILIRENNGYTDYTRATWTEPVTGKKYRGYVYHIEKPLSGILATEISNYSNVRIGSAHYRYAPEIKISTVFLSDVAFRWTYEIRQIDALTDPECGWDWNESYYISDMETAAHNIPAAFRRALEKAGIYLVPHKTETTFDGSVYEIIDRKTKEPLFAAIPKF